MSQYEDVKFAKDEFEELWKEAEGCEITAEDLKINIERTYLKGDISPYDLYIKMLIEYFSDRVMDADVRIHLMFQRTTLNTIIKWMP